MQTLLERLKQAPLLGDGAIGTLLFARGVSSAQCLEALSIQSPELITQIHLEYALAGADVVTSHTFGANQLRLDRYGLGDRVVEFNHKAVDLALSVRKRTGLNFLIAGNVGPTGVRVEWENVEASRLVSEALAEQIEVLSGAGADLLLFETFSDLTEAEVAIHAAKALCALPIVACMSFGKDGLTLNGEDAVTVSTRLLAAGADVVGANCSTGPEQMVETMRIMRDSAPLATLCATPNAGLPFIDGHGQARYPLDATAFAGYGHSFLEVGVRWIGGCCGTTPEHIRAMRAVLDGWGQS